MPVPSSGMRVAAIFFYGPAKRPAIMKDGAQEQGI